MENILTRKAEQELKKLSKRKKQLTLLVSDRNNDVFRGKEKLETVTKDLVITKQEKDSICNHVRQEIEKSNQEM